MGKFSSTKKAANATAKASTKQAPAKKAAAKKAATGEKRPRLHNGGPNGDKTIKLLVTENPKRPSGASHARFALYKNGMSVKDFVAAGGTTQDVAWDVAHGYIELKDAK